MDQSDWVPDGIDTEAFSAARVYDYVLGGVTTTSRSTGRWPDAVSRPCPTCRCRRRPTGRFLHRAVRWLVGAGVRQFLDLGSGIPTRGNVHEVAQKAAPDARVVYVDIDPVAVAHSRHMLASNQRATAVQEDLRKPEAVLEHPEVRPARDCGPATRRARPRRLPGDLARQRGEPPAGVGADGGDVQAHFLSADPRDRQQVARFFTGLDLVDTGVVWAPLWHPADPDGVDEDPGAVGCLDKGGRGGYTPDRSTVTR